MPIKRNTARDHWIRKSIEAVTLAPDKLTVRLNTHQITQVKQQDFPPPVPPQDSTSRPTCLYQPDIAGTRLTLHIQIKRHDGRRMLLSPDGHDLVIPSTPQPKPHLVDAIGRAYRWHQELIATGESVATFAKRLGVNRSHIHNMLWLTRLGPAVLKSILVGTVAPSVTLDDLFEASKSLDWQRQAAHLGLANTSCH